jgi:hypothetical protein
LGHELNKTSHDKKMGGKTRIKANTTHGKKRGVVKLSLSSFFENQIYTQGHLLKLQFIIF